MKRQLRNWTIGALAAIAAGAGGAGPGQADELLRLSTLGAGSSPYLVMSTFANIANDKVDGVEIEVNATGAATRHAMEAARGETDFFMGSPSVHAFMKDGKAMYAQVPEAPELARQVRALLTFPLGSYHIVAYADSGIDSLDDLAGKRVFLGPPGGGALAVARSFVEAATGLSTENDMEVVQLGWDAAAQAFQDGQLDVYVNPTLAPSPVIQQLALARPVRLIGFTEAELAQPGMQRTLNRPGGTLDVIPADIYGDNLVNEAAITTIGSNVQIAAGAHVSEDTVYRVTKAFWDNIDAMHETQPWMRHVTLENALHDMNMPLHPGAARYYKEIGVEIPPELMPPSS